MEKHSNLYKFLSISGAAYGIIGALLVASGYRLDIGYVLFLLSSLSWVFFGALYNEKSILVMNIVFAIINIIGLYNYAIKGLISG